MNDRARKELCNLIASRGISVCDNVQDCAERLRHVCLWTPVEADVLVLALKWQVVHDLLAAPLDQPWETVRASLARRLVDELGMTPEAAGWAVASWAMATGKIPLPPENEAADDEAVKKQARPAGFRRSLLRLLGEPLIAAVVGACAGHGWLTLSPILGDPDVGTWIGACAGLIGGLIDALDWGWGRPIARRTAGALFLAVFFLGLGAWFGGVLVRRIGGALAAGVGVLTVVVAFIAGAVIGGRFGAHVRVLSTVGGVCTGIIAGALGGGFGWPAGPLAGAVFGGSLGLLDAAFNQAGRFENRSTIRIVREAFIGVLVGAVPATAGGCLEIFLKEPHLWILRILGGALAGAVLGAFAGKARLDTPVVRISRRYWLPVALTTLLLTLGTWVYVANQPLYEGKRARAWKESLRNKDARDRLQAALILSKTEPKEPAAVPVLIEALADPKLHWSHEEHEKLHNQADTALASFGPAALPAILTALRAKDKNDARDYISVLAKIGSPAVLDLVQLLADEDPKMRWAAAEALERMRVKIPEAIPALIRALKDNDNNVRWSAEYALAKQGADAVPALCPVLQDKDPVVRRSAVEVLGKIGPKARESTQALRASLQDDDPKVRQAAAEALTKIKPAMPGKE